MLDISNSVELVNEEMFDNNVNSIKNLIYYIRGKQVMLDTDLAELYNCKNGTKTINQAVKRNIERFPERFMFQLTEEEYSLMWSQIGTTLEKDTQKYRRKEHLPFAFTEQGVAMLATVIRTNIAIDVSISIMDAFVEMRKVISSNRQIFERLTTVEYKLLEHDNKINKVFDELQKDKQEIKQKIFFKGQIWDSYELIIDIIKTAKTKITIIDNYIDYTILKMLQRKNKNVEVIILTSNHSNITKLDIKKFNEQHPVLNVAKTNKFHDRFIIIDDKELYHCGASLKDLGKKCFAINKMEEHIIDKIYTNFPII